MGAIEKVEFTEHSVTARGGMKLMKDLLDSTKIKSQLQQLPLPEKASNRGYDIEEIKNPS